MLRADVTSARFGANYGSLIEPILAVQRGIRQYRVTWHSFEVLTVNAARFAHLFADLTFAVSTLRPYAEAALGTNGSSLSASRTAQAGIGRASILNGFVGDYFENRCILHVRVQS